jgi:ubiquitin carboxyl-terminal hydrolase L3
VLDTLTSQWSQPLGLPKSPLTFQDLFSLDDAFLAFVPKPVMAVLLLFPSRGGIEAARAKEEKDGEGVYTGEGIWWIKQTVSSARLAAKEEGARG